MGRPFHKVTGTRKRAGRGVMENQGRPGFSVEGLWEGTPREERVTARARAWGGPPRTLGKGWSPGDCGWERASAVDFGPDGDGRPSEATALFSVFRVNRSPTLTETTHTGRITDSAPDGSQEAIGLGRLPGARAASPRPRRRHHPPESAAGPEDLRAGRPPRPRPCPFEGRCLRPERAKQGGSAAASRGPRHPPIGGATE